MRTTKVIVLNSLKDVERFCSTIETLKREAPKSLKLMVAITAEQETETLWPDGVMATAKHHVEDSLAKLDRIRPRKHRGKTIREVEPKPAPKQEAPPIRKSRPLRNYRRQARPASYRVES